MLAQLLINLCSKLKIICILPFAIRCMGVTSPNASHRKQNRQETLRTVDSCLCVRCLAFCTGRPDDFIFMQGERALLSRPVVNGSSASKRPFSAFDLAPMRRASRSYFGDSVATDVAMQPITHTPWLAPLASSSLNAGSGVLKAKQACPSPSLRLVADHSAALYNLRQRQLELILSCMHAAHDKAPKQ